MGDLQRLVSSNYSSHWKGIGIELGISLDRLNGMENSLPGDPFSRCNNMLIQWCQSDEEASWNKIIKAIDIVAASNKNYSCSISSSPSEVYKTREAILDLACRLKEMSKNNRYKADLKDDNWPIATPKHFTSVALIHHKGERTKRELLDIANLQKRGNFDLDKIHTDGEYFKQSKCSKKISDIFAKVKCANGIIKSPGIVLIEGVPGIGKTVLSKEIVFQWAEGKLLPDHALVFLIPLRDPESQKINSVESFINYFGYTEVTEYIVNYIIDSKGKNITIVFDGYDELSEELRTDSFLFKMMTQNVIQMTSCNVVITSRPNVSAYLHDIVDLRVEILGFTNEDREAYIVDALKHDDNKIEKLMTYLNNNPAINAYCYIPLNMTILLNFFESSDTDITELPNTQTGINEKFICTTISRYIRKLNGLELDFSNFSNIRAPCDDHKIRTPCVGHEKGVPYGRIFKEISKLAFKALEKDKIVFTTVELQETCPCLEAQSENWNGLGLLKPVQLFTVQNISRNVSFNFLHFTIQEILAAYHITLMSKDDQLKCMKQTFWDNRYYNTWIMYVGLTKNQMPITFKHFLSGNRLLLRTRFLNWWKNGTYCSINRPIFNDKIKCLHLFQCFSEAENIDLCQYVGQLLQENEIDLSGQTLSAVNILTISLFLTRSTTRHWNIFNLSECYIGDDGIMKLHNSFTSNNRSKVRIDTLNLSHNNLTQSSVESIAGLILEWDVKDIMFNEINQNNLYQDVMHQVMHAIGINNFIACNFNENEVIFAKLSQSDYLILSISSTSGKRVHRIENIFTGMQENNIFRLKMIICALNNYTSINYLSLGVDISPLEIVDMAEVIANNNFIEYLYLSKMQYPGKVKLKMICDALKSNKSLQYVDMSLITIDSDLISDIAVVMKNNSKLKEIKVSKLILTRNDFQHLGNYLVKITGLKSLNITGYIFNRQNADKLVIAIKQNYEIWQLNLSNCKVPLDHLLTILSYKSIMEKLRWLDLTSCHLHSKEMKQILSVLKEMEHLQHVNLSANIMESDAITDVAAMIKNNQDIQVLSLPNCVLNQKDFKIVIQAMQTVSSLEYVDFNNVTVDDELASDVALLFTKNSRLKEIRFTKLELRQIGFQHLNNYLVKIKGLTTINMTGCSLLGQDAVKLVTAINNNSEIQELKLSNCKISANQSWSMLSRITKLKYLELSQFLRPNTIKETFGILKWMNCLQHVDLSANNMRSDAVNDVAAMIKNNQDIQVLSLPNCVLDQRDLRIIIQAMQTVSSLEYVDFNKNTVDNELASDVALLFTKNSRLRELRFTKLTLNQIGFQHLSTYLVKIKGLTTIIIIDCSFVAQDAKKLMTAISPIQRLNFSLSKFRVNINDRRPKIKELNLSNCRMPANQSWSVLSHIPMLNHLNLSHCLLQPNEIKEIFGILKWMNYLKHVDLSANIMKSDAVNDVAAMIKNNKYIQSLSLPNGIIKIKIVIQAMQTVSSLEYVDFNNITVDDELASDVALLFTKNSRLKEIRFTKLELRQIGFQHLNNYLVKIKGLTTINMTGCSLLGQDAVKLVTAINNNSEIQELKLSNCKISANQSWSMLSRITKLKYLELSQFLRPNNIKEIFGILKWMNCLQHVDLSANSMGSDAVNDVAAMIKNNQDIQALSLPDCVLDQKDLMIIIQAMQTVSSLEYVDFNNNTVDNELASDVALLFTKNSRLRELRFTKLTLNQIGFQHLSTYLVKIKGLTTIIIIDCSFVAQDAKKLMTAISPIQGLNFSLSKFRVNINDRRSKIKKLNLSNCKIPANQLWSILSCITKLKYLNLSRCLLQPNDTKEIFGILKRMKCLQHVNLSANSMRNDAVNDVAAMIKNNQDIKALSLPNCVLDQKDLMIIIQAMQTVSSLEYVDFNNNTVDDELASDVALLFTKNNKLKELRITRLTLNQIGFQHLYKYLVKIKRLTTVNIIGCSFIGQNAEKLVTAIINNNSKIQELNLSNCKIPTNQSWSMLSCIPKLKYLNLSHCLLHPNEIKEIFGILKWMKCLQHVDLSANIMGSDTVNDVAAMIKNSKHIQSFCLPISIMNKKDFKIVIQAMQTVSSLQHVDFSTIEIDNDLANDISSLLASNSKLELNFCGLTLKHSGFQHLMKHFAKLKGIQHLSITDCMFTNENIVYLNNMIGNNHKIRKLLISNCKMIDYKVFMADNPYIHILISLSCSSELRQMTICNCQLQPDVTKQILMILKNMRHLETVDLSGNDMTDDSVSDMKAMIVNNKQLQKLCLPNCVLDQKDLKIIIQAMQTVSLLEYVDFSTNEVDNELAKYVALLIANNSKLQKLKLHKLTLTESGFQHLKYHLMKFKGIKLLNINGCAFTGQDATAICIYSEIQELNLSRCKISIDHLLSILSCTIQVKWLDLSYCQLHSKEIKQILGVLKSVSSLRCVDFSTNKLENELASDVVAVITNNHELKKLVFFEFAINEIGFYYLKNYLGKFREVKLLSIIGCSFTRQNAVELTTIISNGIQEINLTQCSINIKELLAVLSCKAELRRLNLSNCQLTSSEIKQILSVLKHNVCLQHVDLSGNIMSNDVVNEMATMIKNNRNIQVLFLPTCFLSQKDLRIIIQAMQTVSSLQCVDFNTIEVDNELAYEIATLIANNHNLKELIFAKLTLEQNSFKALKGYLGKFMGLKHISITDCNLTYKEEVSVKTLICNNNKIQELLVLNCEVMDHSIFYNREVNVYICKYEIEMKEILMALKYTSYLQYVDLSGSVVVDNIVFGMEDMIIKNKQLQRLCFPTCVFCQGDLRILIQAMCSISSLQYVDLNINKVDDKLASDVARLIDKNRKLETLKIAKLELCQYGFQHLKADLMKIKGLKYCTITNCSFSDHNEAAIVLAVIQNNPEIQELDLSNCDSPGKNMEKIIRQLKYLLVLRYLNISHITFDSQTEDEMIDIINNSSQLEMVDIVGCNLSKNMFSLQDSIKNNGIILKINEPTK